jgi:cell wall integrity and stress response component
MMRPSFSLATSLATSLLALYMAQPVHALDGALPAILMGCYSSSQGMLLSNTSIYDSSGFCQEQCFPLGKPVMAMTGGNQCWCGDEMPNLSTKVDDGKCTQSCDGYPADKCTHT